jgi:hypothetical protein
MSKELKDIKKSSVEYAIRKTAADNKAYGLDKNVTDERNAQHVGVCKAITEFADTHEDIPMYLILSLGIAQGAPKKSVYGKGYTAFNSKRVETIIRRCKAIVKAQGCEDIRTFDSLSRVVAKFTDQFGNDPVKFAKAVKAMGEFGKSVVSRENYDAVCKALGIDPEQRIKPKRTTAKTPKAEKKTKKTA